LAADCKDLFMEHPHEKYRRLIDYCRSTPPTPTAVAQVSPVPQAVLNQVDNLFS